MDPPDWYASVYPVDPNTNAPSLVQYPQSFHDIDTCLSCLGLGSQYMATTGGVLWCGPGASTSFVDTQASLLHQGVAWCFSAANTTQNSPYGYISPSFAGTECIQLPWQCPEAGRVGLSHALGIGWLALCIIGALYIYYSGRGSVIQTQRIRFRSWFTAWTYALSMILGILWSIDLGATGSPYQLTSLVWLGIVVVSFFSLWFELITRRVGYRQDLHPTNPTGACCGALGRSLGNLVPKLMMSTVLSCTLPFLLLGVPSLMSWYPWLVIIYPRWILYQVCPLVAMCLIGCVYGYGPAYHMTKQSLDELITVLEQEVVEVETHQRRLRLEQERRQRAQARATTEGKRGGAARNIQEEDPPTQEADVLKRPRYLLRSFRARGHVLAFLFPCAAAMNWVYVALMKRPSETLINVSTSTYAYNAGNPVPIVLGSLCLVAFYLMYQQYIVVKWLEVSLAQHAQLIYGSILRDVSTPILARKALQSETGKEARRKRKKKSPLAPSSTDSSSQVDTETWDSTATAPSVAGPSFQPSASPMMFQGMLFAGTQQIHPATFAPATHKSKLEQELESMQASATFLRGSSAPHLLEGIQALSPLLSLISAALFAVAILFSLMPETGGVALTSPSPDWRFQISSYPLIPLTVLAFVNLLGSLWQQYAFSAQRSAKSDLVQHVESHHLLDDAVEDVPDIPDPDTATSTATTMGDHSRYMDEGAGVVEPSAPPPPHVEYHRSPRSALIATLTYLTSWKGQQALTLFNHSSTFIVTIFALALGKFGDQNATVFGIITAAVSGLGTVITLATYFTRTFEQFKFLPTDDSFRITVLFKATLLSLKAQVLYASPSGFDYVYLALFTFSLTTLAVFTFVNVVQAWKQRKIFHDIHMPRLLLIGYIMCYLWNKIASIVMVVIAFVWGQTGDQSVIDINGQFVVVFFSGFIIIMSYSNNEIARYLQGRMEEEEARREAEKDPSFVRARRFGVAVSCGGLIGVLPFVAMLVFSAFIAFEVIANPVMACNTGFGGTNPTCRDPLIVLDVLVAVLFVGTSLAFGSLVVGRYVPAQFLIDVRQSNEWQIGAKAGGAFYGLNDVNITAVDYGTARTRTPREDSDHPSPTTTSNVPRDRIGSVQVGGNDSTGDNNY